MARYNFTRTTVTVSLLSWLAEISRWHVLFASNFQLKKWEKLYGLVYVGQVDEKLNIKPRFIKFLIFL